MTRFVDSGQDLQLFVDLCPDVSIWPAGSYLKHESDINNGQYVSWLHDIVAMGFIFNTISKFVC